MLIEFLNKHFAGADIRTCYEAGFSGFHLHRKLLAESVKNIIINPSSLETSSRDRVKTDKRDSKKLAEHLAGGRLKCIFIPSEQQEQARLLTRTREQIVRSTCRVRVQIRMKLHQFGLIAPSEKRALTQKMVKEILSKEGLSFELKLSINSLVSIWESLNEEKKNLEQALKKQAELDSCEELWRSLPGFGVISSRVMSNELGDMSQFPNERTLFSFTGLTPGEYSSGEKVYRGHISRQGSSHLRHVLVEAAWRAIRQDAELKESYERIKVRRGGKRAIVAVARKLVGRARALFKKEQRYILNYSKKKAA